MVSQKNEYVPDLLGLKTLISVHPDLENLDLTPAQYDILVKYTILLVKWNATYNFTKYTTYEEVIHNLLVPSLHFSFHINDNASVVDLGSGPGIPGVPLLVLNPSLVLTTIDSNLAINEFLKTCVYELSLKNCTIICDRAEKIAHDPDFREKFDFVLARSVSPLPMVIETGSGLIRQGGSMIVQCSRKDSDAIDSYVEYFSEFGLQFIETCPLVYGSKELENYYYLKLEKTGKTPRIYPRAWKKMKNYPMWR